MFNNIEFRLFIGLFFSFIYILVSKYWSLNVDLYSDTLQYYYYYQDIKNNTFPISFEYFSFLLMFICDFFDLDFRGYLFVNYLIWIPLVFYLFFNINKSYICWFVGFFFFSHFFMVNAAFLIRQYNGFLFFLYFLIFFKSNVRFLFLFLSLISHLSSMIFLLFINKFFVNLILEFKKIFLAVSLILYGLDITDKLVDFFNSLGFIGNYSSLVRKFEGVSLYYSDVDKVRYDFLLLNIFSCVLICFFTNFNLKDEWEKKIYSVIFASNIFYIVFASQPVISNRIGFVAFAFIIPSLIFVLRGTYVKFKF